MWLTLLEGHSRGIPVHPDAVRRFLRHEVPARSLPFLRRLIAFEEA